MAKPNKTVGKSSKDRFQWHPPKISPFVEWVVAQARAGREFANEEAAREAFAAEADQQPED